MEKRSPHTAQIDYSLWPIGAFVRHPHQACKRRILSTLRNVINMLQASRSSCQKGRKLIVPELQFSCLPLLPNALPLCSSRSGIRHTQEEQLLFKNRATQTLLPIALCRVARWPIFRQNWPIFADFKSLRPKKNSFRQKKAENRPILEGPADKMPIF